MFSIVPAAPADIGFLRNMVALLADPAAAAERTAAYLKVVDGLRETLAQMQIAQAELIAKRSAQQQAMAAERREFDADCMRREVALAAREARMAEMESKLSCGERAA